MTGPKDLNTPAIYAKFHGALVQVHGELREGVGSILSSLSEPATAGGAIQRAVLAFTQTLFDHHKSEDAFFFPAFRAAGRLRSSDVAFLDARDAEHRDIHRLCEEMHRATLERGRGALAAPLWEKTVRESASELGALSTPHFALEESTLTAAHLADLITVPELENVYRDMGKNWHRR